MIFGQQRISAIQELLHSGYRYALALVVDESDADDLVHDAWMKLYPRYGKLPDKALLFRTIRTLFIDVMRHRQRFEQVEFDEERMEAHDLSSGSEPPDKQLANALSYLRPVERETLFLSVVEGYTAEEIAALTKRQRGTVLSMLHRTKRKMKQMLSEEYATDVCQISKKTIANKSKKVH